MSDTSPVLDPVVTIAMPTYERTAYLREAIDGALNQTFKNFELIISDNSTSEAVAEIVATYDDPRITYDHGKENVGPLGNWMNAISLGTAPFVASLHDDDRWEPEFLATLVPSLLENEEVAMAFCDYWIMDGDSVRDPIQTEIESRNSHRSELIPGVQRFNPQEMIRATVVWNAAQPAYAALMRRQDIVSVDFPTDLHPIYDIWATYVFAKQGRGFYYEPRRLSNYRVHANNLTSAGFGHAEDVFFQQMLDDFPNETDLAQDIYDRWSLLRWGRATRLCEASDWSGARQEFAAAAEHLPSPRKGLAVAAGRSSAATKALHHTRMRTKAIASKSKALRGQAEATLSDSATDETTLTDMTLIQSSPVDGLAGHDEPPSHTTVAVAVCTHQRNDALRVLLKALTAVSEATEGRADVGVVVIDDNPDGRAESVCNDFTDSYSLGLRYVHVGAQNISIARNRALTEGMDMADWVVLTDDDCDPTPGWLGHLLEMQHQTKADIVTGPFQLKASEQAPKWFVEQGFVNASIQYPDASIPPHGCTANALLRTDFLTEHEEVRFLSEYGETGGEDMVFFHTAELAGAEHRYALKAMMHEHLPVERTQFWFSLTKNYWFGNNMVFINRTTREYPAWRMLARGSKVIVVSALSPLKRITNRQAPHFRKAAHDSMIGLGLVAGVFGMKAKHH